MNLLARSGDNKSDKRGVSSDCPGHEPYILHIDSRTNVPVVRCSKSASMAVTLPSHVNRVFVDGKPFRPNFSSRTPLNYRSIVCPNASLCALEKPIHLNRIKQNVKSYNIFASLHFSPGKSTNDVCNGLRSSHHGSYVRNFKLVYIEKIMFYTTDGTATVESSQQVKVNPKGSHVAFQKIQSSQCIRSRRRANIIHHCPCSTLVPFVLSRVT